MSDVILRTHESINNIFTSLDNTFRHNNKNQKQHSRQVILLFIEIITNVFSKPITLYCRPSHVE